MSDNQENNQVDLERKGYIDVVLEKALSRKLLVFLTATGLMAYAGLSSETWGLVAACYIGGQSVIDLAQVWRHGR